MRWCCTPETESQVSAVQASPSSSAGATPATQAPWVQISTPSQALSLPHRGGGPARQAWFVTSQVSAPLQPSWSEHCESASQPMFTATPGGSPAAAPARIFDRLPLAATSTMQAFNQSEDTP